ncbi:hypothetical protein [Klebsiella michiganensis]|uniref:hypothetical protein n=1 Tax=Klebsiella michiganensis TaxID=1134687 RepID=UPI001E2E5F8B|nr:hypothetical protein [Klebsiella michiganensis]UHC89268.1 hypothetical protein LUW95_08260 [Klebsiella michiganensis]
MSNDGLTLNQLAERNAVLVTEVEKLRAERDQLAAENVALKAGRSYFMYSDDAGFETHSTREEAIKAAEEMIDDYRGDAGDGFPEEAGTTRWGVIIQQATECDYEKPSAENGWMGSCDYRLLPETPATDRIVAGIKADAITASLDACSDYLETDCVMDRLDISYEDAEKRTSGAIEFHDVMVNFANQMREGAK